MFITSHFSVPFFNKIKNEKLSERVYRFPVFLFIEKNGKIENCSQHLSFFFFFIFLIKNGIMENWAIGMIFFYFFFSFFDHNGKNEEMVQINMTY